MIKTEFFRNKRILITGGLGFIGSNLAGQLVNLGANVTVVDSLISEYGGNLFNINGLEDKVNINISDVRDEYSMKYLIQDHDYLFNLAGQTSHMDSMDKPIIDLEINSKAQLSILEACRQYNSKIKVIFASTRQIYGRPQYLPVDENHPIKPVDVNGINKVAGEWYHILYNNVYGISTCVLRLTNTYGPRMRIKDDRQTFLGIWIRSIIEGENIEVWGGTQLRDFNYVDDCIDAMLIAAERDEVKGQIYNLGANPPISLKDLANMLIKINKKGKYILRSFPKARKKIDIGDYYSDYKKFSNCMNWHPKVGLQEGLRKTLKYYKKYLKYYI